MFTPLILFLGLLIATAVIAYWSDNLGKKLGKKRVSLLGMRPRTTATFLTITSSWVIMVVTLAALLAVATPLRRALFRYEAERAQYREDIALAETRLKSTGQRLSGTQESLSNIQKELHKEQGRVKSEQKNTQAAIAERQKAEAERLAAQNSLKTAQRGVAQAQKGERSALQGARQAQANEKKARRLATEARQRAQEARADLNRSRANLEISRRKLEQSHRRLSQAQRRLKDIQNKLGTADARYIEAQRNLAREQANVNRATATVSRASTVYARLGGEVLQLETRLRELQQDVVNAETGAALFAQNEPSVRVNQTFAARIIAPNQSPQTIAATVRALFEQAQSDFRREQGANPSSAPEARLQLLPLPDPEKTSENIVFLEGEQIFQRLARDIAAQSGPTSVRLVAARNFLAGETDIAVRFVMVPVAVAFSAGESLASMIIDGGAGDARIFNQLFTVLIEMGRKEAEKRGVNPPLAPDEPNFFASGTNVSLFEALRRIEASKRAQRVTLVAAKELSTVEPLQVRFEVSDIAPTS
ncbi:MAG: DUF3084 domain-containing protein [Armatimonadetes bacterium]|nr:DUF3084 domain-containing protein [Armatimonadota bacterium]